ncbi:MAG: hypothetical protein JXM70_12115 [Pirellulales bacterium]|nr:hypothetical protein [Pirellulales bacterium]
MKTKLFQFALVAIFLAVYANKATSHCEIPCGIYDDELRIKMLLEHVTTIEKSMKQITELEKADHHHANQLVRWIMNKEKHADELQEIVAQYFMTQRIKLDTDKYAEKLGLLHQMLIYGMKCKQTTDLENIEKLRGAIKEFEKLYFGK